MSKVSLFLVGTLGTLQYNSQKINNRQNQYKSFQELVETFRRRDLLNTLYVFETDIRFVRQLQNNTRIIVPIDLKLVIIKNSITYSIFKTLTLEINNNIDFEEKTNVLRIGTISYSGQGNFS